MARPKKEQKVVAPAPVAAAVAPPALLPQVPAPALAQALPDNNAATLVINRADYARLRDSVSPFLRLSTLLSWVLFQSSDCPGHAHDTLPVHQHIPFTSPQCLSHPPRRASTFHLGS